MEQKLIKANVDGREVIGVLANDLHKTYINTLNDHRMIEIEPDSFNEYTGYNDSDGNLIFHHDHIRFIYPAGQSIGVVTEKVVNDNNTFDWVVEFDNNAILSKFIGLDGLCDVYCMGDEDYRMYVTGPTR